MVSPCYLRQTVQPLGRPLSGSNAGLQESVFCSAVPGLLWKMQQLYSFSLPVFPSPLYPLQDIAKDFPRGEESLERLEEQSVGVIQNTSPLGAEKITGELEEMRKVLEKLRALWEEEEERLRGLLQSRGACEQQIKQLEAELSEFRMVLQRLAQEGLQPAGKAGTEDELVAHWRRYSVSVLGQVMEPRVLSVPRVLALRPPL